MMGGPQGTKCCGCWLWERAVGVGARLEPPSSRSPAARSPGSGMWPLKSAKLRMEKLAQELKVEGY